MGLVKSRMETESSIMTHSQCPLTACVLILVDVEEPFYSSFLKLFVFCKLSLSNLFKTWYQNIYIDWGPWFKYKFHNGIALAQISDDFIDIIFEGSSMQRGR